MSRNFDGGDRITVTDATPLNPTTFSITVHLRKGTSEPASAFTRIIKKSNLSTQGWVFLYHSDFRPFWALREPADEEAGTYSFMPTLATDTPVWHTLTFDGSTVEAWVDGASVGTTAFTGTYESSSEDLIFGRDGGSEDPNGTRLAEVSMVTGVLSEAEIVALHSGVRISRFGGDLLGYWPFNGVSSPEPDYSGNVNNGVITSGTIQGIHPGVGRYSSTPRSRPQIVISGVAPTARTLFTGFTPQPVF